MTISIHRATPAHLDALVPLFDAYRRFYAQESDEARARDFLRERLERNESVIFLALRDNAPAGFTQLYPMFSSVRAARTWILNDLYVDANARRRGVAQALLSAAETFAGADGAVRLELETMHDNRQAQALYERQGWQRYDDTQRYRLPLPRA